MEYRKLGRSDLEASVVGLGCNPFGNEVDAETAVLIVSCALDNGVTFFDTAPAYYEGRSEEYLGRALRGRRQEAMIATKFNNPRGAAATDSAGTHRHIMQSCEDSLRRLETDYIDLFMMHNRDRSTPIEVTLRALDDLVRQGKVRYVGCSNFFEWEICEAVWTTRANGLTPFVASQDFYNLLYRDVEKRMEPFSVEYGIAMIPYSPLAGGLLTGIYQRGVEPAPGSRGAIRPLQGLGFGPQLDGAGRTPGVCRIARLDAAADVYRLAPKPCNGPYGHRRC